MKNLLFGIGSVVALGMIGVGAWLWNADRSDRARNASLREMHGGAARAREAFAAEREVKERASEQAEAREVIVRELVALRAGVAACETLSDARAAQRAMARYVEKVEPLHLPREWIGVVPATMGVGLKRDWFSGQIKGMEQFGADRERLAELRGEAARLAAEIDAALLVMR